MKDMKRILVIGCSGAGKTTLALELGQALGLPVVHLDRMFWRSGWQAVPNDEFDALLLSELEKPEWIIDGNYIRTLEMRLKSCDTVIYLDYPRIVCMYGVLSRVIRNLGQDRPDMGTNCPERLDLDFIRWTWSFNKKFRDRIMQLLNTSSKRALIFRRRRDVKFFLETLSEDA